MNIKYQVNVNDTDNFTKIMTRMDGRQRSQLQLTINKASTSSYCELIKYIYIGVHNNRFDRRFPLRLTVVDEPLYDVYHVFDFGHVKLRVDFVGHVEIYYARRVKEK